MRVVNKSGIARALSHRGQEHRLLPGAGVDVPMTAGEAKALSAIFDISGQPEKEQKEAKAKAVAKDKD